MAAIAAVWPAATRWQAREEDMASHDPVMVNEVLEAFRLQPGAVVVDGTLGLAGHSLRFAERIAPGGTLVGFDWDESMLNVARERLASVEGVDFRFVRDDYRTIQPVLTAMGLEADAILLDLGLNSAQIDDPERGISFSADAVLDMRMDRSSGEPASALLNRMTPGQIERALEDFGDERWAHAIAKKILERRRERPLRTTTDLVECVLAAIPVGARDKRIHPATRTFQAVRILANRELDDLDEAIMDAASALAVGGTLAVLSYHSGEDRPVKLAFRELARSGEFEEATKKPLTPTEEEVRRNPRSRSAKLRVLRRISNIQGRSS